MNNEYFRKFITLSHENGQSSKSFGTVVVEQRSGVNKLTLSISNIRPNILYTVTFVKVFDAHARFVDVLSFRSDNYGNASCKAELSMKTLQNIDLCDFNVCIIRISESKELLTPLVGYFNEKVKWREYYIPQSEQKPEQKTQHQPNTNHNTHSNNQPTVPPIITPQPQPYIDHTQHQKPIAKELKKVSVDTDTISIPTKPYEFGFNTKQPKDYINPVNRKLKDNIDGLKHQFEPMVTFEVEPVPEIMEMQEEVASNPNLPKKYKIKPLQSKKSTIELITDCDDFEYRDSNVTYTNTDANNVLEQIKVEIHNLKNLAQSAQAYSTECSYESLEKIPYSLDGIFEKNQMISPFKNNSSDVDWVIIDYSDLILIDTEQKFIKNPFFRNTYKRFSHFIFGKCIENSRTIYMLGVPDFFNHEYEQDIRDLGFISFRESTIGAQQGYWIIVLQSL